MCQPMPTLGSKQSAGICLAWIDGARGKNLDEKWLLIRGNRPRIMIIIAITPYTTTSSDKYCRYSIVRAARRSFYNYVHKTSKVGGTRNINDMQIVPYNSKGSPSQCQR